MARRVILDTQYTFSPSTQTVTIPRALPRERLLLITNVTTNQVIYNFSDPALTATSYSITQGTNTTNPVTTVTLSFNTTAMLATHQLQIVVDEPAELFAPDEAFLDPVGKIRTSQPQALIDTDFEYGLQPTKWETLTLLNNRPSFYVNTQSPFAINGVFATNSSTTVYVSTPLQTTTSIPFLMQDSLFQGGNGPFLVENSYAAGSSYTISAAAAGTYVAGQGLSVVLSVTSGTGFVAGAYVTIAGITGSLAGYNTSSSNPAYVLVGGTTSITVLFPGLTSSLGTSIAGSPTIQQSSYFTYTARYAFTGTTGQVYNSALTQVYTGSFYTGAAYTLPSQPTVSGNTITVATTEPHGLQVGDGCYLANSSVTSGGPINSSYQVAAVTNSTSFQILTTTSPSGTVTNAAVYPRPDGVYLHRAFDGGVQFTTGNQAHNNQTIRQTRRYFRYQSGKGIQISTGTILKPNINVDDISSSGTTVTVTTKVAHQINPGATIVVSSANETAYNGTFVVTSVLNAFQFTYTALSTPSATPATGLPTVSVSSWYGAVTRLGLFDNQNGMFFEFDGQTLYAVRRRSTDQIAGWVSVTNGSAVITGATVNGVTTKFTKQLVPGDFIVIRGSSYRVLDILSDTSMTITPPYRGATLVAPNYAIISKTVEVRVPQSQFNIDKLDGTGPSGLVLDLSKMQMFYLDYSWYGAGSLRLGFRDSQGKVIYVHRFVNNNQNTEAWMRSGNLPARYETNTIAPKTLLGATIDGVNTSILQVANTTGFPSNGTLLVADPASYEYISYTGLSGNTFTGLTRGKLSNTVASVLTTNNSATLTTTSAVTGVQPGMLVTGTGIPNGTYVYSIVPGAPNNNIVMTQAATATGTVTINVNQMASANAPHTYSAAAPIGVYLHAPQFAPTISHWGTSVIMDGQFDNDKSLIFTFGETIQTTAVAGNVSSVTVTSGSNTVSIANTVPIWPGMLVSGTNIPAGTYVYSVTPGSTNNSIVLSQAGAGTGSTTVQYNQQVAMFSVRSSPAVDSGVPSSLGLKEILNRMQLTLNSTDALVNGSFLIQLILNGTPIASTSTTTSYTGPNGNLSTFARIATGTSSLAQIADHTGPCYVSGGEVIYGFYAVNSAGSTNQSVITADLTKLRDLGNSILGGGLTNTPGTSIYPDGPDVLTVVATNIGTANAVVQGRLSWTEAQA